MLCSIDMKGFERRDLEELGLLELKGKQK